MTAAALLELLDALDRAPALRGRLPELLVPAGAVDLAPLGPCVDLPGIERGQLSGCRWSLPDGRGLHLHRLRGGRWRFHLDHVDPLRHPLAHLAADTAALAGLALGTLAAAPVAALAGPRLAVAVALLGGVLGAHLPAREPLTVELCPDGALWAIRETHGNATSGLKLLRT
ncbi:MAG: hypothetical protein R3F65_33640 [bacterium]